MDLYLVVHHRKDNHQPYPNSWLDDSRLEAITTTEKVSILCKEVRENGQTVYIHPIGS